MPRKTRASGAARAGAPRHSSTEPAADHTPPPFDLAKAGPNRHSIRCRTVLLEPEGAAATTHVVLAAGNPAAAAFPESASFATIVPAAPPSRVMTTAGCAPAQDVVLQAGEALTLTCARAGADLSGTRVESDSPHVN